MNMIWLCITSLLSITQVISEQNIDTSHIRVFPALYKSIAGVFQVSSLNDINQTQYAFNASEARRLCWSLSVNIASKAQVNKALTRGLETCRFGWIDEHLAVIPRKTAASTCGQNQTGLVIWRAPVTRFFDVFCFNESDAATQLKDTTTVSHLTKNMQSTSSSTNLPSPSPTPETIDNEVEVARFVGSAQGSAGATAIIITSTCALLLTAIIIAVYIKMRGSHVLSSDTKHQQEYIQTEEWTCAKNIQEKTTAAQEDERIEMDDNTS